MDVNTKLIIVARDYLRNGQAYVLSLNAYKLDFPTIARDKGGSHLRELVKDHILVDINWINPQLLDVDQPSENTLDIFYCGMIPFDTQTRLAFWLSVDQLFNEEVKYQKLVMKAVNIL